MTGDEFERTLSEAFDARAREAVPESAAPPPPRFATAGAPARPHRRARLLAPLAAAAVVVGVVTSVAVLRDDSSGHRHDVGVAQLSPALGSPVAAAQRVHIKLLNGDGARYGVGMPVVAFFSKKISSAAALRGATTATVNGKPLTGAWYFESSSSSKSYPVEAHWRPENYWPEHAKIHLSLATKGLPAGSGLRFDDSLTLDFATGARTIAVVDDASHRMTVTSDGKKLGTFPVSLGTQQSPTSRGTKVIMEKGKDVAMRGPGYFDPHVRYTQRLTYSGEYLHSAPWNIGHINGGIDSSNGCTNLLPADAERLYKMLEVGDVVQYPNATGRAMTMGDGFGDWNIPWKVWQQGGALPVR